jgi:VWFA-related protein
VEFLLQILKARSDRGFVMGFDVTPSVTADWTNDIDKLQAGVNRLRPGGGTALFDAVYTACRDKLLDTARGQEPVRKAMILISDGDDNQSRVHPDEAIKECQRAETIIYAISTNWTPSRGRGDKVLKDMADETGGQVFFPPSVEEMSTSFKDIEQELRSQYALTYIPADFKPGGPFRPIYLYCNDRHYQVRAKKGYFPKQ